MYVIAEAKTSPVAAESRAKNKSALRFPERIMHLWAGLRAKPHKNPS